MTKEQVYQEQEQVQVPKYLTASKVLVWIIYAWTFLGVILLSLRTFLLLFSANIKTPFVDFVYRTSADFLQPFRGIFPPRTIGETGYLDVAALFAIIMYILLAWGISSLLQYLRAKIDEVAVEHEARMRGIKND